MRQVKRHILVVLVSLGLTLLAGGVTAQAKSQLPKRYQGTWYGYVCSEKVDHVRTYNVVKVGFTRNRFDYAYLKTTHSDLSQLDWQWEEHTLTSYGKKVNKHHQTYYTISTAGFADDINHMRLVTVKVNGQRLRALKLTAQPDNLYAFRKPLRTHAWGWDFEDFAPTDV
ncbi:hypothetical protein [Levilactobacillus yonginensis]|uniref:hypothetical protein n=1 Tax=Levilactobacillus yonginensis TaxID=1054041 RepID=UPI00345DDBF8